MTAAARVIPTPRPMSKPRLLLFELFLLDFSAADVYPMTDVVADAEADVDVLDALLLVLVLELVLSCDSSVWARTVGMDFPSTNMSDEFLQHA